MTYRVGHHSTSDDASRYRGSEEPEHWKNFSPISRLQKYLFNHSLWTEEQDQELWKSSRAEVLQGLKKAEKEKKPKISELFTDVYDTPTPILKNQELELLEHLKLYPNFYPIDEHEQEPNN